METRPTFGRRGLAAQTPGRPFNPPPPAPPQATGGDDHGVAWLLFSFNGRLPRSKYWLGQIGVLVMIRVITFVSNAVTHAVRPAPGVQPTAAALAAMLAMGVLLLAALGLALWGGLALVVKRWHDRDRSAAWALLGFLPIVGWVWQGVECGFLEGTLGPNRYGPSPKGVMGVVYADPLAETFS